jgi:hypothetical protein
MIDISSLMSAVKPKERTDQYVILAALFVLNAHRSPVNAKQVSDLLNFIWVQKYQATSTPAFEPIPHTSVPPKKDHRYFGLSPTRAFNISTR